MSNSIFILLQKELFKERDILFAYIFGSQATGRVHKESDLDLAIYIEPMPENLIERKLDLIDKISQLTGFDHIDLVILNQAPPLLVHSVMKTGKLLFCKNSEKRSFFLVKNLKEALDLEIHLRIYWEALKQRILENKFGK